MDRDLCREIKLWFDNTEHLYTPFTDCLLKHVRTGRYESVKALQFADRIVRRTLADYNEHFGCALKMAKMEREFVAYEIVTCFEAEYVRQPV